MEVLQLVRFCILMENGGGILEKSPDYILEKFKVSGDLKDLELLKGGLDGPNQWKLDKWIERWGEER